jgi:hypothetical protein
VNHRQEKADAAGGSCRTLVLPDQGHSVLVERAGETAEAILEWVGPAPSEVAGRHRAPLGPRW